MISSLKKALEEKIGFNIDSVKACRRLEQILLAQKIYVSDTTLSRIFSVSKKASKPRKDTLNLLAGFWDLSISRPFNKRHPIMTRSAFL